MPLLSCPSEIIKQIIASLFSGNNEVSANSLKAFSGCTTACQVLSIIVRPHLFRRVRLWNEERASILLDLISVDPRIATWIRVVVISTQRKELDKSSANSVTSWLGSASKGGVLMLKLQHVQLLHLEDLHPDAEVNGWNEGLDVDAWRNDTSSAAAAYVMVWQHLRRLRTVTHLVLERCEVPSWHTLIQTLDDFCPALQSVSLWGVQVLSLKSPPDTVPPILDYANLQMLSVRCCFGDGSSFYNGGCSSRERLRWFNFDNVTPLLKRLRCVNLTSLVLAAHPAVTRSRHYSAFPQDLLVHATRLKRLVFETCSWIQYPIDLSSCTTLQYLAFRHIRFIREWDWIPDTLASLTAPLHLEGIQISGDLEYVQDELWDALDVAFSGDMFRCNPNSGQKRMLLLEHISFGTAPTEPLDPEFAEKVLPMTYALNWFNIRFSQRCAHLFCT